MLKVIHHVRYDTDRSVLVAATDTGERSERLYRTWTAHFFLVVHDPKHEPIDELYDLTEKEAIAHYNKLWLKNPFLNPNER